MKTSLLTILSIGSFAFAQAQTSACSELFISEYVEGTGNDKGAEIYNPTANPINLSNYRVVRYSNGSTAGTDSLQLTGTIGANDVWVIVNGQTTTAPNSPACSPALQAMADQLGGAYPDPLYWNGNDAFALIKISPYMLVDIFGKIGEDPGTSWTDVFPYTSGQGTWLTYNHTLQRKATVTAGVMSNPTAFNVVAEWDSLPNNTWTGLGSHTCDCASMGVQANTNQSLKMSIYPNPSSGVFKLDATENIASVELVNLLGQVVYNEKIEKNDMRKHKQVSLNTQPAGLYLLNVKFENGQTLTNKININ
ncbi:MAG: hypothetical protein FD123_1002 [Bacteroidetes bacterium]|nr:MAG: hypothetical protein FD123_1002 [Bacteroidota bacterium]